MESWTNQAKECYYLDSNCTECSLYKVFGYKKNEENFAPKRNFLLKTPCNVWRSVEILKGMSNGI